MAVSIAQLGLVDPLAAGVTKPNLLTFGRFMRFAGTPRLQPVTLVLGAVALAAALTAISPSTRTVVEAGCSASSTSSCPTPTPVNAFLSLDVTQGPPTQVINVTGGQFNPNESLTLYWDTTNHVAGSATADGGGNFNSRVMPFAGDQPGLHHLCASVPPHPCANFTLVAATPSPSPSPTDQTPQPSASAGETPILIATPARVSSNTISGFDVITRPPFVFLPIFGLGALILSLGYWAFTALRRPRRLAPLPSAAVVHRATRPDYSAGVGAPPPSPAPQPQASAWDEPMHTVPPSPPQEAEPPQAPPQQASTPSSPEQPAEWGPPVEWGTGGGDWGFPEPPPPPDDGGAPEPRD